MAPFAMYQEDETDASQGLSTTTMQQLLRDEEDDDDIPTGTTAPTPTDGTHVDRLRFRKWWQRIHFIKAFTNVDNAGGGNSMSPNKMGALLASLGLALTQPERINLTKFLEVWKKKHNEPENAVTVDAFSAWFADYDVRQAFKMFGSAGEGAVGTAKLRGLTEQLGHYMDLKDLEDRCSLLSKEGSGMITVEDFLNWWHDITERA
jgi:Ca2+-binding EF-hand superfamily protein